MSTVTIEIEMPAGMDDFRLPPSVNTRLQHLLDKQDAGHPLSDAERREAEELVDMAEWLSLLRLRATRHTQPW